MANDRRAAADADRTAEGWREATRRAAARTTQSRQALDALKAGGRRLDSGDLDGALRRVTEARRLVEGGR